eukprot:2137713-Rhodomonas_salina.1
MVSRSAKSGTHVRLRCPGTAISEAVVLCACYAMSGTDIGCAATRRTGPYLRSQVAIPTMPSMRA